MSKIKKRNRRLVVRLHIKESFQELKRHPVLIFLAFAGPIVLLLPAYWDLADRPKTLCALIGVAFISVPLFSGTNAIFDFIRGYKDLQLGSEVQHEAANLIRDDGGPE